MPPFGTTEVDIMFNKGISHLGAVVDMALQSGVIQKKWFLVCLQGQKNWTRQRKCKTILTR